MLWFVTSVKLLAEVALMAFAARGLLALLAGAQTPDNLMHRLFWTVTQPVEGLVRRCWPGTPSPRLVPWCAAALALAVWLGAAVAKLSLCVDAGRVVCA